MGVEQYGQWNNIGSGTQEQYIARKVITNQEGVRQDRDTPGRRIARSWLNVSRM